MQYSILFQLFRLWKYPITYSLFSTHQSAFILAREIITIQRGPFVKVHYTLYSTMDADGLMYGSVGPRGWNFKELLRSKLCTGVLKKSMGARNRVGIGLSFRSARLHCP